MKETKFLNRKKFLTVTTTSTSTFLRLLLSLFYVSQEIKRAVVDVTSKDIKAFNMLPTLQSSQAFYEATNDFVGWFHNCLLVTWHHYIFLPGMFSPLGMIEPSDLSASRWHGWQKCFLPFHFSDPSALQTCCPGPTWGPRRSWSAADRLRTWLAQKRLHSWKCEGDFSPV